MQIIEVAEKLTDLHHLPNDDLIPLLEAIRLFHNDCKLQAINNIKGCKQSIIDGWLQDEAVVKVIKEREEIAKQVISNFYNEIYQKYSNEVE